MRVSQVCGLLWELEQRYQLNYRRIEDVYYWPLVRNHLFNQLMRESGGFGVAHSEYTGAMSKKLFKYFVNTLLHSPLLSGQKDILVFDHIRKVRVNEKYIDIYTSELIEQLRNKGVNYEVLDYDYLNNHFIPSDQERKFADFEKLFSYFYRKTIRLKINEDEQEVLREIERMLQDQLGYGDSLLTLIINEVRIFKSRYYVLKKFLKLKKPRLIYVVVSYGHKAMIAAAQDLGIKVVEIQHGIISKYHLGYSYPDVKQRIPYYPDQIFIFGEYWRGTANYPIAQSNLIEYGLPHLTRFLSDKINTVPKKKQILFISQGTIGKELSLQALELAQRLHDYQIVYKLHPGEYDRWESEYPALVEALNLAHFTVIDNNRIGLHQIQAESEFQVGVYSTAIYEGLAQGCKTIIMNSAGMEYVEDLIDKGFASVASNADEIILAMHEIKEITVDASYFFANNTQLGEMRS